MEVCMCSDVACLQICTTLLKLYKQQYASHSRSALVRRLDANNRHHRLQMIVFLAQILLTATLVLQRELVDHRLTGSAAAVFATAASLATRLLLPLPRSSRLLFGMVRDVSVLLQKRQSAEQKLAEVLAQSEPPYEIGAENYK